MNPKTQNASSGLPSLIPTPRWRGDGNEVLSFKEWCAINGFSERTGRRILASGTGPTVLQLTSKRIGIRRRDNAVWQDARARQPGRTIEVPASTGAAS
jgi:hypothetical protein